MYSYKPGLIVWLYVRDFEISRRFYRKQLGLIETLVDEAAGWVEYGMGFERVCLAINRYSGKTNMVVGGGGVPVLYVDNIEAAKADLEERGVIFEGEIYVVPELVKIATFYDPDGNRLQLYQNL
jgi:CreA protein